MNFKIACLSLIGGFILVILYFVLLIFSNMSVRKEERNSFANSFPYLYYQNMPMSMRIFLYIILGLGLVLIGMGECLFFSGLTFTCYQFVLSILFPLSTLFLYISNILPLNYYKSHLIFSILAFFFFATASFLTGLIPFVSGSTLETFYNKPIQFIIGAIGLICFASLINPKLANWAKMEKTEVNGKVIYVRPRINFYALYEWIYLILIAVVSLLLFINMFVSGLL